MHSHVCVRVCMFERESVCVCKCPYRNALSSIVVHLGELLDRKEILRESQLVQAD